MSTSSFANPRCLFRIFQELKANSSARGENLAFRRRGLSLAYHATAAVTFRGSLLVDDDDDFRAPFGVDSATVPASFSREGLGDEQFASTTSGAGV